MPRLILLNGPPGIGKSTLAELWADRHPGTLNLDIDRVRMLVGGWCDDFVGVGEVVRPLVLHMAASHLGGGRDVIVPQFLSSTDEVAAFESAARDAAASFVEVMLVDGRESAIQRFDTSSTGAGPLRSVINDVVTASGGQAHLASLYDDLMREAATRELRKIVSPLGDVESAYQALCLVLQPPPPG